MKIVPLYPHTLLLYTATDYTVLTTFVKLSSM